MQTPVGIKFNYTNLNFFREKCLPETFLRHSAKKFLKMAALIARYTRLCTGVLRREGGNLSGFLRCSDSAVSQFLTVCYSIYFKILCVSFNE